MANGSEEKKMREKLVDWETFMERFRVLVMMSIMNTILLLFGIFLVFYLEMHPVFALFIGTFLGIIAGHIGNELKTW